MFRLIVTFLVATMAVTAITIGTLAAFSDTETSTGNVITAGSMDLQIDLSGVGGKNVATPFVLTDLTGELLLTASGVVPGDFAEATVSIHTFGNVDPLVVLTIAMTSDLDNSCEDAEEDAEGAGCNIGVLEGELDNNSDTVIWYDYGVDGIADSLDSGECDNIQDTEERFIFDGATNVLPDTYAIDGNPGTVSIPNGAIDPMVASTKSCIGILWSVLGTVGNIIQSDSFTLSYEFAATTP